jgi:hypothetical protein
MLHSCNRYNPAPGAIRLHADRFCRIRQGHREYRWPVFEMTWLILRPSAFGNGLASFVATIANRRRWARRPTGSPECFTCTADELSPGTHQRNELFLSKTELGAPSAQRAIALIQLYQGNARVMPIAAHRKWLNFKVQGEVMTAGY